MKPRRFHHDFETFCEIDLQVHGASRYARHESCEVLMLAWSWDDDDRVKQWIPVEIGDDVLPAEVEDAMLDDRVLKYAWNKSFEWNIWKHVLGIETPHRAWRDPMVMAYSLSLPGSLEKAGAVVDLTEDKQKGKRGKQLIRKFCIPHRPSKYKPWLRADWTTDRLDWIEFCEYNRQDVVAEKAFYRRVWQYDLPEHEWELWFLDQEINEAGIPVNLNCVENAIQVYRDVMDDRMKKLVCLTGLPNPNSTAQLLPWLRNCGYHFEDLKKGHVARAKEDRIEDLKLIGHDPAKDQLVQVLSLRQEVSKSSVKKYQALQNRTDYDGNLRYAFQFAAAARTWRWGGRGYQAQNLARPARALEAADLQAQAVRDLEVLTFPELEMLGYNVMDLLSTCVRPVVQAPEGYVFVDADLNAIENRVLGWIARCARILAVFKNKHDPYVDFSRYMFGGTYESRWHEYKVEGVKGPRTLSKPAVLGCGYQMGPGEPYENTQTGEIEATGLLGYAWNIGVREFTQENAILAVKVWRDTFSECVDYWYAIEAAAKRCIRTKEPQECWPVRFDRKGPFMRMRLPSGRYLHYVRPKIEMKMTPWKEMKATITYEEQNEKNQWVRAKTHGGKLTENADQAISRDLLAHGMTLAHKRGIPTRLHVHDQLVGLVREDDADWGMKTLLECMEEPPSWALDCPLGAAGNISKYFIKD